MRALIHAELLKLCTTRTVFGLLAAMLALVAAGVVATLLDADEAMRSLPVAEQEFVGPILGSVATTFILVLGLRSFTDEFATARSFRPCSEAASGPGTGGQGRCRLGLERGVR